MMRDGHHTAVILERAQRRLQGMIAEARDDTGSRARLTEERDAISRVKMALRRLKPEHVASLSVHPDDCTAQDGERQAVVVEVLTTILSQPEAL